MLKKIMKNLGTILWTILVLAEVAFGAYCTIVYLISNILLGQILGIVIMLPGAAWFMLQIIKDSKMRKEETKDEELT
jgi:flagellar biosynthesis protein FlhB